MATSLKVINAVVIDTTLPVEQKGFNAVAILDFTSDKSIELIFDASTVPTGTSLSKAVSKFFGNGASSVYIAGAAYVAGDATAIEGLVKTLVQDKNVYGFTAIHNVATLEEEVGILNTLMNSYKTMCVDELMGAKADLLEIIEATNSKRMAFVCKSGAEYTGDASGLAGYGFKYTPGTVTYSNRALDGASLSGYTDSDTAEILNSNGIVVVKDTGYVLTRTSNTSNGSFIDVTTSSDYIEAKLVEELTQLAVTSKKIPYTEAGLNTVRQTMNKVGIKLVEEGVLATYVSTTPDLDSIPTSDKANRVLNNVQFEGTLSGSIETINLAITIKV